jgi:threonine dehydrogenase-like Zn-dependent dehydrogenase
VAKPAGRPGGGGTDAAIQEPTDAVVRITSSGLCGCDLHLYEVLGPFMSAGDILGHESMGVVAEVGSAVSDLSPGDRVVMPFQISCGTCFFCRQGQQTHARSAWGVGFFNVRCQDVAPR